MLKPVPVVLFALLSVALATPVPVPGFYPPPTGDTGKAAPVASQQADPDSAKVVKLRIDLASLKTLVSAGASVEMLNSAGAIIGQLAQNGKLNLLAGWHETDIQGVKVTNASGVSQVFALADNLTH